jgi:hypothetical protein
VKKNDVFPSKYLKCSDLQGRPITVTIENAPLETLETPDGKEQKQNRSLFPRSEEGIAA